MELHFIDLSIIIAYLLLSILIGFWVSKKASKDINSYFLGGNNIPWYVLGISNASGMFDITGTMWLVYLCFVYGLKSAFIPWLWPVFNQVFLFVFLSIWLRKSNVMTGAEWIKTRFGKGRGAELSHIIIVVFAIVSVIGFLAYAFKGIGKFSSTFLPWDLSPNMYALIFMGITTLYVIKGGMYSVVLTELMQFIIMTVSSIAIGIIAMNMVSPEALAAVVPEGWMDLSFGWNLNLDWSGTLAAVNEKITSDGYSLFTIFFMMMLFKGFLVSAAGPAPNYDMQRVLATKKPSEAAKMSWVVNVALMFPRYMMIAGLSVIAIVYFMPEFRAMGSDLDLEKILPMTIKAYVPVGLMGVMIAGLLAAFMSTFAATVNAAPAYLVNDIYKKYINKDATPKTYVKMSYIASFAVVILGIGFGFVVESINSITQWLVSALWGGYTAANMFKWYWWRFNGFGYFWGMVVGIIAALVLPIVMPDTLPLYGFPYLLAVSVIGCVAGTLLTSPEDDEVLMSFYKKVKPWGFWGPVYKKVIAADPSFEKNKNFGIDMFNVVIGIILELSLVVMPIYMVIHNFENFGYMFVVFAVTSILLKVLWWDRLKQHDEGYEDA